MNSIKRAMPGKQRIVDILLVLAVIVEALARVFIDVHGNLRLLRGQDRQRFLCVDMRILRAEMADDRAFGVSSANLATCP